MTYDELFSPGTKLADVKPEIHGISLLAWRMGSITKQCSDYIAQLGPEARENAPINKKRIWNPRDDYGWRS